MTDSTVTAASARAAESPSVSAAPIGLARFGSVLVGVDGRPTGRDAIALGDALRGLGGKLTLAHVVPAIPPAGHVFYATRASARPPQRRAPTLRHRRQVALGLPGRESEPHRFRANRVERGLVVARRQL
jgi:hypothetical protein